MARKYKKRITKEKIEEITPMFCKDYLDGMSYSSLTIKYDICEAFVSKLVNKNNLKKRGLGCKTKALWKNSSYKKHMSKAHKGNPGYWKGKKLYPHVVSQITKRMKENPIRYWLGKECPHFQGEKNPGYIDGGGKKRTLEKTGNYRSNRYRRWRSQIFVKDDFTCQECGQIGGELCAHHIKEYKNFPKLRYRLDNGITLCKKCHLLTDNYGSKLHGKI